MRYAVWLSGEHPGLALAEIKGAAEAEGAKILEIHERVAVVDGINADAVFRRMGYAKRSSVLIASGTMEEVISEIKRCDVPDGTFSVRAWKYSYSDFKRKDVERRIGEIIARKRRIDLSDPDFVFSVYLGEKIFAGIEQKDVRGLKDREPMKRPFFSPVTLGPKMARALINISRAPRGSKILDPFCGTGAILLEAGIIGMHPIGIDISEKMIEGARKNLEFYRISADLHHGDISQMKNIEFDFIATDPPYGRSSSTGKEDVEELYKRAFEEIRESMEDGYVAIILPDIRYSHIAEGFSLVEHHSVRVHRSLTRHFCVFRRN